MLNRAEDTGSRKTLKHARGPGSGRSKSSPKSMSRRPDGHSAGLVASRSGRGNIQHATQLLSQVGMVELLEQDERPTFIVDLEGEDDISCSQLNLLFTNPALRAQSAALESIEGKSDDLTLIFATTPTHRDFKLWVLSNPDIPGASEMSITSFVFAGFIWRFSTIRDCLRVVHGDIHNPIVAANEKSNKPNLQQLLGPGSSSPRSAREIRPEAASYFDSVIKQRDQSGKPANMPVLYQDSSNGRSSKSSRERYSIPYDGSPTVNGDLGTSDILTSAMDLTSSNGSQRAVFPVILNSEDSGTMNIALPLEPGFFDWTRLPVTPALPLHIQFARSIDWGATSLGLSTLLFLLYPCQILLIQS